MGFGFSFFFILVVLPASVALLIAWIITRKHSYLRFICQIWLGLIAIILAGLTLNWLRTPPQLHREDYTGSYIIDRSYFPGAQADWQYNHFRFEILPDDSIRFYVTDGPSVVRSYPGHISIVDIYDSSRLKLQMDTPVHHILAGNPTTYRQRWQFHLVFYSALFNNVYFTRGEWKPITPSQKPS